MIELPNVSLFQTLLLLTFTCITYPLKVQVFYAGFIVFIFLSRDIISLLQTKPIYLSTFE